MDRRYLPSLIMLIAGAIVSIHSLITHMSINDSLIRLFMVLIVFYLIGSITNACISKILSHEKDTAVEDDETQESAIEEESQSEQS